MRVSAPGVTIESERFWRPGNSPSMAEPYLTEYLDDLSKAGLPEDSPALTVRRSAPVPDRR